MIINKNTEKDHNGNGQQGHGEQGHGEQQSQVGDGGEQKSHIPGRESRSPGRVSYVSNNVVVNSNNDNVSNSNNVVVQDVTPGAGAGGVLATPLKNPKKGFYPPEPSAAAGSPGAGAAGSPGAGILPPPFRNRPKLDKNAPILAPPKRGYILYLLLLTVTVTYSYYIYLLLLTL